MLLRNTKKYGVQINSISVILCNTISMIQVLNIFHGFRYFPRIAYWKVIKLETKFQYRCVGRNAFRIILCWIDKNHT